MGNWGVGGGGGGKDTETGYPARLPARVLGDGGLIKCTVRKIIFFTKLTRTAKAGQKSIVPAPRVQRTNQGKTPIIGPLSL
jgi:hypothetical protein